MTQTDVPVLLIGFNRPESMRSVINAVRAAAPRSVYFAIDGPRIGSAGDHAKVQATRDLVQEIDWSCEIYTLFREVNLGCAEGVSGAITWFFDHVSEGIILEDDIIPTPDFFPFIIEMLNRYRFDHQVFSVTGSNRIPITVLDSLNQYRFCSVPQVWGWGTWRDRWQTYSLDISGWRKQLPAKKLMATVGGSLPAFVLWSANFDLMARMAVNTWDLQLVYCAMRQGALTVTPNVNLVTNIGWGIDSTHTQEVPPHLQPTGQLTFPLESLPVMHDLAMDKWTNKNVYGASVMGLTRQAYRLLRSKLGRKS
jgi:hypothetical protein